jgi:hypothetical protein
MSLTGGYSCNINCDDRSSIDSECISNLQNIKLALYAIKALLPTNVDLLVPTSRIVSVPTQKLNHGYIKLNTEDSEIIYKLKIVDT